MGGCAVPNGGLCKCARCKTQNVQILVQYGFEYCALPLNMQSDVCDVVSKLMLVALHMKWEYSFNELLL